MHTVSSQFTPLEHAQDQSDLGAALNGFSLNESGPLAASIEKVGQAADAGYLSTTKLVSHVLKSMYDWALSVAQLQDMEQNWGEPLHEYAQFATIIKRLLAYRHQKHVQFEMTQESLDSKRGQLEDLESSEREANRLASALTRGRPESSDPTSVEAEGGDATGDTQSPSSVPPHPGSNPARRRTRPPGSGLLNALSYTLHGMMDVDPETARRNNITKLRENISQVCGSFGNRSITEQICIVSS